jgi:hypothetical protein
VDPLGLRTAAIEPQKEQGNTMTAQEIVMNPALKGVASEIAPGAYELRLRTIAEKFGRTDKMKQTVKQRHEIARNPSTPADVLVQLGTDKNKYVRMCVASNP